MKRRRRIEPTEVVGVARDDGGARPARDQNHRCVDHIRGACSTTQNSDGTFRVAGRLAHTALVLPRAGVR